MNFNRLKLKWKVFVFLICFCALLLAILWLFQTVLLDTFYKNIRIAGIQRDAAVIISNAETSDITEIIKGISENSDIIVEITDMNGRSALRSMPIQDRRTAEAYSALITLARDNGGEFYEYSTLSTASLRYGTPRSNRLSMQSLIYVKLANKTADDGIAVIIRAVISPVNATVTTLRYQLYFVSGIMLLLSVILAVIIAKRVSKPIEVINQSAMSLAKGDYDTRFSGKGFHEIIELSDTLNTAALELGKVENLRRELLANVSHDLRTPLSLIYSYAEMMNDFPGEITSEQTKVIMDETRRLTTLVNDVLDITKLESDIERLNVSRFSLTRNISETISRVEQMLESDGYHILFERNGFDDIYVDADETKISRAFYNLLVNAINYSGDGKVISVEQIVSENRTRISVTDCGEGISEDELPFIWDRYYKSKKAHKRALTGTGLGLSIVKKIIELHGGSYGVNTKIGTGSTFWFEVSVSKPEARQDALVYSRDYQPVFDRHKA